LVLFLYFTRYAHYKGTETYRFMLYMNQFELSRAGNTDTIILMLK